MSRHVRAAALAAALALAACGDDEAESPGLLLNEPSAVAVFHGLTPKHAGVHPYLAIANAGGNDVTIVDAVDDSIVLAPVPLRPLVYPVPGRPMLLASARLGDDPAPPPASPLPDLLVAVAAGDSRLQVIRTWDSSGAIEGAVELGGDVLALTAVPAPSGFARIAAALSGERLAVVTFDRLSGQEIDVAGATVAVVDLGVQPVAVAAMPDDPTTGGVEATVYAATAAGVVPVDVSGAPSVGTTLDAGGPTRLVAAARLAERGADPAADPATWTTTSPVERVYAILDESGCGPAAAIECDLVALDPGTGGRAPGFATGETAGRAPIPIPGAAVELAASGPPAFLPSTAQDDQIYAPPFMRIWPGTGPKRTTGVAAVASTDGTIYFVDLGRWELGSDALGPPTATVTPADPGLAVTVTPGFTPTVRWTVTWQGELPGLAARRAEVVGTRIGLQVTVGAEHREVVQVAETDVLPGDIVVVQDPAGVGACASFDAEVASTVAPEAGFPGGALEVAASQCLTDAAGHTGLRATVRAGEWVVVRGAALAGRAEAGTTAVLEGRRIGYATTGVDTGGDLGTALAFTIPAGTTPEQGEAFVIQTSDGRTPFRAGDPLGGAIDARGIAVYDRTTWTPFAAGAAGAGVRFIVPYSTNVVLDVTPTLAGGGVAALR
jgi:hypothetical protein